MTFKVKRDDNNRPHGIYWDGEDDGGADAP